MLSVKRFSTILDVDALLWDSLLKPGDIYNTHRFIRTVEQSQTENATFFYFLFYDHDRLAGATVISALTLSLDLFIAGNPLVALLKKVFPSLFAFKLLVCGLPASFGQLNLTVADPRYADEVSSLVAQEMTALAKTLKITLMAVKEFKEGDRLLFRQFERSRFFLAHSIPYMTLDVPWHRFEDYLSSLRHHYRRKILLSLKKMKVKKPVITPAATYADSTETAAWVISKPETQLADDFHLKYLKVMERTPTKLETLNLEFFKILFQQKDIYELLNIVVKGKLISSAILIQQEDVLNFMLVGREFSQDDHDSYFNMVYGIIELAIERRCRKINLGQTAYWVKQCVGGTPAAEYIYVASRNKIVHVVLKLLRTVLFPDLKLPSLQVFHEKPSENGSPGSLESETNPTHKKR